jgi:elongation factor P
MNIGSIRPGMALLVDKELFQVVSCEHSKLARGSAFCRVKLRSHGSGKVFERTLRDSDDVEQAQVDRRKIQYLYTDGRMYNFMDLTNYDDLVLDEGHVGDSCYWLKENTEMTGLFFDNKLITLELPSALNLTITETEPGIRGDTVKSGTKPARLETGAVVQVPLFINQGETVIVNPHTGEYQSRA